jgi:hypothetical protein
LASLAKTLATAIRPWRLVISKKNCRNPFKI